MMTFGPTSTRMVRKMDREIYDKFFELMDKIVNEDVGWSEKIDAFTAFLSESEKYQRDFDELLSWIEP